MIEPEEKGTNKEKLKYVSKLVTVSLIISSLILGIVYRSYANFWLNFDHNNPNIDVWSYYFHFSYAGYIIIIICILAYLISVPGFIAFGVYSYFLYEQLEYSLYLRSETSYQPKLKYRLLYIALVELGVFIGWCFFSGIFLSLTPNNLYFSNIFHFIVLCAIPEIYLVLKRRK